MKRRTFFSTLVLFLLFIYLGIISVSIISLQNMVTKEKNQVLDKHYFITNSLIKDFSVLKEREENWEGKSGSLVSPYSRLSSDQKTEISFYRDEKHVFSSGFGVPISSKYTLQEGARHLEIQEIEDKHYIIVDGHFPQPYDSFRLLYQYDLTPELSNWWNMVGKMFAAGSILSVALAILLLAMIEKLFRPLENLSNASKSVSAGRYDVRLPLGRGEEIDDLSNSFNSMAGKIGEQIEVLEEALDSRQRFVDNFSHEMRTPLTAIYGTAQYLQITEPNQEEIFSGLSGIMLQSTRLQSLSTQLLELAGLGSGGVEWNKVQISDLFKQVSKTLQDHLQAKNITLQTINTAEYIYGDSNLLVSLFVNLLDNAINASQEESEIKLTATTTKEEVLVTLEDFGKGIDKTHIAHIMEPFYRGDSARSRGDGGTGLGLSICGEIVKRHNATISFSSVVGEGTTVLVTFTTSLLPDDKSKTPQHYTLDIGYPQNNNRSDEL